jgi:GWxTD domain-containing protein
MYRAIGAGILLCSLALTAATKKTPLSEIYKTWLDRDVVYIITDEERKNFLALDSDAARDDFMQAFWDIRNPLRGSQQNPFKEEHYRRIEYANSHFGRQSNTPGSMTDMGRAYILFGKPTSQHPFIGYGQLYPLELWFYSNPGTNPSLPPFFYLMFYMPDDIGEYRFYRPYFDGPQKLVRGSQFNSNRDVYNFLKPIGGDLAHAAFSLVPNDPIDTTDFTTDMTGDMLVSKIQNLANDSFNVRRIRELRSLKASVSSYFLLAQDKPLDVSYIVLSDPTGKYWLDYNVLIDDEKLGVADATRKELRVSLSYRLTTGTGDLIVEDTDEGAYAAFDGSPKERKLQPFLIAGRLPIVPGSYGFEIQIVNRTAGRSFRGEQKITVGPCKGICISGPLVASSVSKVVRPDPFAAFQYYGVQFHPVAARRLVPQEALRVLFEVHQAPGSTADYDLEYVLASTHDREARRVITDEAPSNTFKDGRLLKSKTIPLAGLPAGDYRLVLNVRTKGSSEVAESKNIPLRIDDARVEPQLFLAANSNHIAGKGVTPYIRALEAIAQKDEPASIDYLQQVLRENPANSFGAQSLVQLYFNRHEFAPIAELYGRLGIDPFKSSPESLVQISLSFRNTGNPGQARDVIEAAKGYFPNNSLLVAAETTLRKSAGK